MFAAERNELLTRVGGGTPVGELFRRYWLPVLLGEELPEPDCPPVRQARWRAGDAPPGLAPAAQGARAVAMVVPREMSLPDAVAMAQKDPAKTVSAA
jgi:hypothetical protein